LKHVNALDQTNALSKDHLLVMSNIFDKALDRAKTVSKSSLAALNLEINLVIKTTFWCHILLSIFILFFPCPLAQSAVIYSTLCQRAREKKI
jgi:hypothetical protein